VTAEPLTDTEGSALLERAQQLADADQPQQAIELLEDGIERARHDAPLALSLRHALAGALFYADEHSRAASLFDSVGREFARQLGNDDPIVADCSYYSGWSYAEIGSAAKALAHLRFYVSHAAADDEQQVEQLRESRYLIGKMLSALDRPEEARAEYRALRPLFVASYGPASVHVRNLDRQIALLGSAD
jgi:hypothetical protein